MANDCVYMEGKSLVLVFGLKYAIMSRFIKLNMFEVVGLQILEKFLIAVSLAFLVGLERERQRIQKGLSSFGGIRTFPIIALMGALSGYLLEVSELVASLLLAAFAVCMAAAYIISTQSGKKDSLGLTSTLAALVVYFIGFIAFQGEYFLATGITMILLIFLYMKNPLHLLAEKISSSELQSTIKFVIIAFIVLPLLPNQYFGFLEAFNPYLTWLMVVFISGISFVSYLVNKLFGYRKGIGITGFFAGLVSSTALTLSFSALSKDNKKIVSPYVFAILIASSAMFVRVLFEVFVISNKLFTVLIYPLLAMSITSGLVAVYFALHKDRKAHDSVVKAKALSLQSPFHLKPAIKFAGFFALIFFVTRVILHYYGTDVLYISSFVSGLVDIDAITLSIAQLVDQGLDVNTAVMAITIAAVSNTLVKVFIFLLLGNRKVAYYLLVSFLLVSAAGLGVSLVL